MHSYLIVSKDRESFEKEAKKLLPKDSKTYTFSVTKIEDAQDLNSFLNLSLSQKTLVLIEDFHHATEECANALLKTLEEPQENVVFAIHTTSENAIIPTIRSRCTVFTTNIANEVKDDFEDIRAFLKSKLSEKLVFLTDKKTRPEVINIVNKLIHYFESEIRHGQGQKYTTLLITELEKTTGDKPVDESSSDMSSSFRGKPRLEGREDVIKNTLTYKKALEANGNINLQTLKYLTGFTLSTKKGGVDV